MRITVMTAAALLLGCTAAAEAQDAALPEPPLAVLLDSAALVERLRALAPPPENLRVKPIFSVFWDSTGGVSRVEAIYEQIPEAYAAQVVEALRAHARPQSAGKPVHAYVRVTAGPQAGFDRPRVVTSPPGLANRRSFERMFDQRLQRLMTWQPEFAGRRFQTTLRFRVLASGRTAEPQVVSSSGRADLDREAVDVTALMRFRPARVDGVPASTWVTLPVAFAFEEFSLENTPPPNPDPSRRPRFP